MTLDPREVGRALGGTSRGRHVIAPGPGHSRTERSLSIEIDPAAPDGFRCRSFAGDDWRECREPYLVNRGIAPDPWAGPLRFNPRCPRPREDAGKFVSPLPAMVALVEH